MFELSAYYFDWDQTLTKDHVYDWGPNNAPNPQMCSNLLKPGVIEKLREILNAGHHLAIVTNGTVYRIPWILKGAGMSEDEISKITIRAAESPKKVVSGFKSGAITKLASNEWNDAKNHHFFDDRPNFCQEVLNIIPSFTEKGKFLTVIQIDPSDAQFLQKINVPDPTLNLKNLLLNELKIFLGITPIADPQTTDGREVHYYRSVAVLRHSGLNDLKREHSADLTIDHFLTLCEKKNTTNLNNFFNSIGRDAEIKKLYTLGEKCRIAGSTENYNEMLTYLKTLNSKSMDRTEILGHYFSFK